MIEKLRENNLLQLMLYLHNCISESVNWTFDSVDNGKIKDMISYPPNIELNNEELSILKETFADEKVRNAMRKVMVNSAMYPIFDLFNFIDGTGDIPNADYEVLELVQCNYEDIDNFEDRCEFLHDYFFETYWDWKEKKESK